MEYERKIVCPAAQTAWQDWQLLEIRKFPAPTLPCVSPVGLRICHTGNPLQVQYMISENQFTVLHACKKAPGLSLEELSARTGLAPDTALATVEKLAADGLLTVNDYCLTAEGDAALAPFKVDNAVIMAAGLGSRFVPLSLEKPKGLYSVRGEVLVERQIRQLQEAGVRDITLVVGYMKEQFFYLQEKFGVKLVVNPDYFRFNNTSTLMLVKDRLANTYICCSDNYFTVNPFESHVYRAYYAARYAEGKTDEYCLDCDADGRIKKVTVGGSNCWFMAAQVFFSREFSEKFVPILEREYALEPTKHELWEDVYARHTDTLAMYIRKYDAGILQEFDSLDDLRLFDPYYINNCDSAILKNICNYFSCKQEDISDIRPLKKGLTNVSLRFTFNNQKYIYRHPGVGTEEYISRQNEYRSMQTAEKLGLDKTFLYMDVQEGWKLSRYIENSRIMDYHNEDDVKKALRLVRKLHDARVPADYEFNMWKMCLGYIDKIQKRGRADFADFTQLFERMREVYNFAESDECPKVLCHCDTYAPNFLVHDDEIELIDWEYSGSDDPCADLGTFICCSDYSYDEAMRVIALYYGHTPTTQELRHATAYVAIAAYQWFLWAIYQESMGKSVDDYLLIWYQSAKLYAEKALEMYR